MGFLNLTSLVLNVALPRSARSDEGSRKSRKPARTAKRYERAPSMTDAARETWLRSWTIRPL